MSNMGDIDRSPCYVLCGNKHFELDVAGIECGGL